MLAPLAHIPRHRCPAFEVGAAGALSCRWAEGRINRPVYDKRARGADDGLEAGVRSGNQTPIGLRSTPQAGAAASGAAAQSNSPSDQVSALAPASALTRSSSLPNSTAEPE